MAGFGMLSVPLIALAQREKKGGDDKEEKKKEAEKKKEENKDAKEEKKDEAKDKAEDKADDRDKPGTMRGLARCSQVTRRAFKWANL